jgi:secreted trypsin-like serine protease
LYDRYEQAGVVAINIQDPSEGADIVVHQDYNPDTDTFENDIALMFLPIGQVADYAQINDDPKEPVVPDPLRVMGWGRTENKLGSESDVLLETTVNYISNQECKEIYADFTAFFGREITDGMMCGYKIDTAHCTGDSGGPLFLVDEDGDIGNQPTQLGIVSWSGKPCGTYPGVYTRVSYYAEWIKETVCSRPEHATKELCGSSKSAKSTKSSPYAP